MKTKLRLTQQNYRYLFENASDAMWVHDMEGNIVDANRACEKLTGYTREELLVMNITKFIIGEFLDTARVVKRKLLKSGDIKQPYEQRLIRKDGSTGIVKMATSLVILQGKVAGFEHVARDVTEEKVAQEMLSKITNGSPIPSFVINKQHKITHWNTAVESLSGIKAERIIGTNKQWQAFYTEQRPTMADLIVEGAPANEIDEYYLGKYKKSNLIDNAYEAEDFYPTLGDSGKWLHVTASPIKNEGGEIIAAIETLRDTTEEKRMQENLRFYVQQITKAQEEERKRIARELHDDTTPPLLLLIQRLDSVTSPHTRPRLSSSLKRNLEDLRKQAVESLENIRRYAQDLRPRILDDLGLIAALEWMADDLVKNSGINAGVEVAGNQQELSVEVELLLFRIAQEALNNTRKHARASAVRVKLEFGNKKIKMTVSDNGRGFKLPEQVDELAVIGRLGIIGMYERARLLGGDLQIQSELGNGTQVVAEVPLPV